MIETYQRPRVTIGLPVFNGENYISESLDSLLNQSFKNFLLIISDNASTDATQQICRKYATKDARIRYIRLGKNVGAAENYNRIVSLAEGDYFKWAAHDDNCRPEFLEKCVAALDSTPGAVLCYPSTNVIDGESKIMSEYRDGLHLMQKTPHQRMYHYLRGNFIGRKGMCNPIFGVIRLDLLRRTRLIQHALSADRLLLGHLSLLGGFIELPDVLFERRVHDNTSTMANRSLASLKTWFEAPSNHKNSSSTQYNNYVALRISQIQNFYTAIDELVENSEERRNCRRYLIQLLITHPKWLYRDIKYSLGYRPSKESIMRELSQT